MKINFSSIRFEQLLNEAKEKEVSIPKLIDTILDDHYKDSHEGVEQHENKGRTG